LVAVTGRMSGLSSARPRIAIISSSSHHSYGKDAADELAIMMQRRRVGRVPVAG